MQTLYAKLDEQRSKLRHAASAVQLYRQCEWTREQGTALDELERLHGVLQERHRELETAAQRTNALVEQLYERSAALDAKIAALEALEHRLLVGSL